MGNELNGAVRIAKMRHEGKILLETSEIIFRGADYRMKIAFGEIRKVSAADGELSVETKDGIKIFEVGKVAEKWVEKMLHPKTALQKLGVKAGMKVRLVGAFGADFAKELKGVQAEMSAANGYGNSQCTFLAADKRNSLAAIEKHATKMKGAEALWVVYPKGKKEITENDVLSAGRKSGLKDVKVVRFSPTHTALKFVLPLDKR
jgi:hypothetical protein